jgi:hypothetical protein
MKLRSNEVWIEKAPEDWELENDILNLEDQSISID